MTTTLSDAGVMFADATVIASARELLHLNDIINGDFRIAQAGTSFPAAANSAYDLDGWQTDRNGAAIATVAQAAGSTAGRLARQVTITTAAPTTAAGDYCLDTSRIEGFNIEKYVGKTFIVSFRARVPVTGIHCLSIRNVFSATATDMRSYVAEINFPTANAWQDCSFTVIGGLPTGGVWNYTNGLGLNLFLAHQAGTGIHTATPNAWVTGNFQTTVNQVNDCATVGNVWAMEKVTMNLGTVAAVSEIDVGDELRRCQRYYEIGSAPLESPLTASGDFGSCTAYFKTTKRIAPTTTQVYHARQVGTPAISATLDGIQWGAFTAVGDRVAIASWTAAARL